MATMLLIIGCGISPDPKSPKGLRLIDYLSILFDI